MDEGQLMMAHWAGFYRSLAELPSTDRPENSVVDDDEELDRWYEAWVRELEREARKAKPRR